MGAESRGVVVGVDGSPSSDAAVEWAAREAASRRVPLTLAYVQPLPLEMAWPVPLVAAESSVQQTRFGDEIVRRAHAIAVDLAGECGPVKLECEVSLGPIVPTLVDLSKGADVIVVGCRGEGPVDRLLLGSVSSGLLHHARCPVAVIHDEAAAAPPRGDAPVLVCIDGSPASETATAIAFEEASRRAVRLHALHVWSDWSHFELPGYEVSTAAMQAQLALAERLAGWQERYPDVIIDRIVACGHPAEVILSQADSAQLVVIGSHGRGGFAGMLLGSVSTAVAESATIPVIVARHS
ncbi:universal stress protein [Mycolicibacterium hodleri]|uniref:Universal stress protein n=1 Tax=Mycolicibacterium hodleri TaxID=49897 RepID=A0A502E5S0_9MYCO|nr:universal stress protein [Mycolicibacterium hodleri]TPG32694.1 universal stress protein [Mycolicibacterium hodleri]